MLERKFSDLRRFPRRLLPFLVGNITPANASGELGSGLDEANGRFGRRCTGFSVGMAVASVTELIRTSRKSPKSEFWRFGAVWMKFTFVVSGGTFPNDHRPLSWACATVLSNCGGGLLHSVISPFLTKPPLLWS